MYVLSIFSQLTCKAWLVLWSPLDVLQKLWNIGVIHQNIQVLPFEASPAKLSKCTYPVIRKHPRTIPSGVCLYHSKLHRNYGIETDTGKRMSATEIAPTRRRTMLRAICWSNK